MHHQIKGSVVWITGATGHLGEPLCLELAKEGAIVLLSARNISRLKSLLKKILAQGGTAHVLPLDLTDDYSISLAVAQFSKLKLGRINAIINNANAPSSGDWLSASSQQFIDCYKTNVVGPFTLVKKLIPFLKKGATSKNGASIVNISSMYAHISPDPSIYPTKKMKNPIFYGTAKAALNQMTRYLAIELAADNIRVNSLSLGPFPNGQSASMEFLNKLEKKIPLGRVGTPHEIVGAVFFLISKQSTFTTGTDVKIDGGMTAW